MTMAEFVALTRPYAGVALVTLTDPARQNNLCWQAVDELADALEEARTRGARVTVVASGLDGHWLEHAWLTDLADAFEGKPTTGQGGGFFRCLQELNQTDVVTIAAVSGDTSGGGCELGWACDLRVAEEQACFSQPEVLIGVGTGIGGTSRLVRLIGRTVTAEMVLDGCQMSAGRLYELGGVNRVVAAGAALDYCLAWAKRMAAYPPDALTMMKRMLTQSEDVGVHDAVMQDQEIFQSLSNSEFSRANMRRIQEVYDSGVPIREASERERSSKS
jgi:enoyl-CoA hydratase/carnithine racemase